jgi:pimeloyl-ACP methyl ester carboxylesterase
MRYSNRRKNFLLARKPFSRIKQCSLTDKIHYIETGNAQAQLCFIHGSPGSWNAFKYSGHFIAEKYRMIAIDRPGFGYSDFGMLKI